MAFYMWILLQARLEGPNFLIKERAETVCSDPMKIEKLGLVGAHYSNFSGIKNHYCSVILSYQKGH